jgi:hypothetical protein
MLHYILYQFLRQTSLAKKLKFKYMACERYKAMMALRRLIIFMLSLQSFEVCAKWERFKYQKL